MSDYNWCHGPECHTQETQSRIRGSGDNKVLRTIRINADTEWLRQSVFSHFCNQRCLMDYMREHLQAIVAIAPRREALETPIKVEKTKSQEYRMRYNGNGYDKVPYISTRTTIKSVDNGNG